MKHFNNRKIVLTVVGILWSISQLLQADPPEPPAGKIWVLNHEMSDEFDANSPDVDKWKVFGKSNSWDRTAAFDERIHEPVQEVGSDNYYLSMNPMWYYEDERFTSSGGRTYDFAGGGMDTRALQTYGYFEVRVKPSDFPMGSGVFMNSRQVSAGSCNEKYHTELDIIENMGFTGPFTGSSTGSFNNVQHVNSHAKPYSDASGSCQALPYVSTNSGVSGKPLADPLGFNTVGMWWQDENTAKFYNNDKYFGTITPKRDFNLPMPVIIVMETYGWGNDENNATNPKPQEYMFEDAFRSKAERAVMYDWVRTWQLLDIDAAVFNTTKDNIAGQELEMSAYPSTELGVTLYYSATANRTITASLYDPSGALLSSKDFGVSAGVRSIYVLFDTPNALTIANGYEIKYELKNGESILKSSVSALDIVSKPLEKKLWREGIPTSLPPGTNNYSIDVHYETDTVSKIVIEMRQPDGAWLGSGSKVVGAGNGTAAINVSTSATTTEGSNYYYKVYMYRNGYDWRDPQNVSVSPQIFFNIEQALVPSIEITAISPSIGVHAEAIDVTFSYAAVANGTLAIQLIDPQGELVAQELRTERSGSRSLTRTIDVNKTLQASNKYRMAIAYTPDEGASVLVDTVYNVVVGNASALVSHRSVQGATLSVYPNPGNGLLKLKVSHTAERLSRVEVYTINGRLVANYNLTSKESACNIDISALNSGVYILKAIGAEGVYLQSYQLKK